MKKNINFISEVCSNHNGSIERCIRFIKTSKEIGCYAVKFQLFKIDQLFSKEVLKKSKKHRERKKWELPLKFLPTIYRECQKNNIKFGCTPFYLEAVDELEPYVDFYKISSYEILWEDLLVKCAKTKKPVIISTGMANFAEVSNAKKILSKHRCSEIIILHCVSEYPAQVENLNLNSIKYMKSLLKCEIGWSDHTRDPLIIKELLDNHDVKTIEFHMDLDKKGFEYKAGHCWMPDEIRKVISFYKNKKLILGKKYKKFSQVEVNERNWRADPLDGLRPMKKYR